MSRQSIKYDGKKFSKDYQPPKETLKKAAEKRSETYRKRRELKELLSLAIKGDYGKEVNEVLLSSLGITAFSIEEALHFIQISKAISEQDTAAYMAIMNISGIAKPIKIDNKHEFIKIGKDLEDEKYED